jgi:Multiple resistance and pH regulation protein F (MrpF / PhaF).
MHSAVLLIVTFVYVVAALMYIVRLVKGPTIPDRVLALDALSFDLAVFLVLLSLILENPVLVFGVIPLVLWIHAVDIFVSKYLEAREIGE